MLCPPKALIQREVAVLARTGCRPGVYGGMAMILCQSGQADMMKSGASLCMVPFCGTPTNQRVSSRHRIGSCGVTIGLVKRRIKHSGPGTAEIEAPATTTAVSDNRYLLARSQSAKP